MVNDIRDKGDSMLKMLIAFLEINLRIVVIIPPA